jgi:hypothetical protein
MKWFPALILVALCYATVASAGERRFDKNFTVAPGGTLHLSTDVAPLK